jgi:hypothetical protein
MQASIILWMSNILIFVEHAQKLHQAHADNSP